MKALNRKLNDFQARFSIAGWLNGDINVSVVQKWLEDNFKALEEKLESMEAGIVKEVVPEVKIDVVDDISMKEVSNDIEVNTTD